MITVKRLTTQGQIEDACQLLHQVYIERQRWEFSAQNPSQIRIESRNGRMVLIDRYIDQAVWFGAYDNAKLMGCIRVCGADEDNLLEFERYTNSQVIQRFLIGHDRKNCVEIGKLAVIDDYVGRGIVKILLLACFRYCAGNQYSALTSTSHGYLKALYRKIEFPLKKEKAFKYESTDASREASPVDFYFADFEKYEIIETLKILECLDDDLNKNTRNIFTALQTVEPVMPTPFYWMDATGVVLGINDLCLQAIGTTREIVGKKPYEFYKKEIADHILEHNGQVIRTGEIKSQEEWIEDVTTKEKKCFSAIKAPLRDNQGTTIGIIGTSIEITAEKEAERLRIENQAQKSALDQYEKERLRLENQAQKSAIEQHEKVTVFARKVAHDLNSPISALKMCILGCTELPAEKLNVLTRTLDRLSNISKNLLDINEDHSLRANLEPQKPLVIHDQISQVITEKQLQFKDRPITFGLAVEPEAKSALANIQPGQFKRAISNLINNAVDSIPDNKTGTVSIKITSKDNSVHVHLKDDGKGMNCDQIEKILNRKKFTEGKANGHGIGLQQVWDMLDFNSGRMDIHSVLGQGTTITLNFPIVAICCK